MDEFNWPHCSQDKWPPFCKPHLHLYFQKWRWLYFYSNLLEVVPKGPIDNKAAICLNKGFLCKIRKNCKRKWMHLINYFIISQFFRFTFIKTTGFDHLIGMLPKWLDNVAPYIEYTSSSTGGYMREIHILMDIDIRSCPLSLILWDMYKMVDILQTFPTTSFSCIPYYKKKYQGNGKYFPKEYHIQSQCIFYVRGTFSKFALTMVVARMSAVSFVLRMFSNSLSGISMNIWVYHA